MPEGIAAAIRLSLTNARAEALNTKVRLIVRHAYGFHAADAVLALVMLAGRPATCAYRSKGGEVTHSEVRRAEFSGSHSAQRQRRQLTAPCLEPAVTSSFHPPKAAKTSPFSRSGTLK